MDLKKEEKIVLRYSSDSDEEEIHEKIFPNNNEKIVLRYLDSLHEEEEKEDIKAKIDKKEEESIISELK